MKKILLGFLLLLGGAAMTFAQLPQGFTEYQLDNGLTVLLWEDHDQPDVFGITVTRAGSIDEPETATGLAHYLEHMLFKGTDRIGALDWEKEKPHYEHIIALYDTLAMTDDPKEREVIQLKINEQSRISAQFNATDEFSNLIQSIGGEDLNAATSYDMTYYHNRFPSYQMERWLTLYADRLTNPVFRGFQAELENVFEEYNMYSDDNAQHVQSFINAELYKGSAYARDIIGFPEDLKNPKLRQLIDFYNTWYVPNNMALILVGNFSTAEVKPLIEKTFGGMKAKPLPERKHFQPTDFSGNERFAAKLGYFPELCVAYDGVKVGADDELALDFACNLLSNSMGIGLLDEMILDNRLMYAVASNSGAREMGRIEVIAIPYMDMESQSYRSLKETEKLVMTAIDQLVQGNVSDDLFEAVKLNSMQEYDRMLEYPMLKAFALLQGYVYQVPFEQLFREKEQLAKLTKEDVMAVAGKYFSAPRKTFEIAEGNPKKDKLAKPKIKPLDPAKGQSEYYRNFTSIPAGKLVPRFVNLKDIDADSFGENIYVYVTPNPKNDIFTLRLKYGVGTYRQPLLQYAVPMMELAGMKGAPGLTAGEFRAKLARLGGKCSYSVSENYVTVDIEGAEQNMEEIVSLVNLHMLLPDFSSENDVKLNNIKGQFYSSRQTEKKSTDVIADAAYDYVLYGDNSPYIKRTSLNDILQLTASQLDAEWHHALDYGVEMHYAGKLPADSVKAFLYSHVPVSRTAIETDSPVERPRTAFNRTELYFLPDATMQQAKVYLLIEGTPYKNTEAVQYQAFNEYFGGGFSGLVLNEIREKRSMAYSAYGTFVTPPVQGRNTRFIGYVGSQSDKVLDALDVYCSLLDSMPQNPENIENIRTILRQSMLSNHPTFRTKSQRMTDWMRLGYSIDPATLLIRQVQKLKFDDIVDFYTTHVQGKPVKILVMGDPKQINAKELKARFGKVHKLTAGKVFSE
ncbi:MAG: insulinase family protein [Paludibacteraceae bacterium]|nr:insulinase family protein [Paludibacteraceae bacterium]